jgi:precorrin-8X/cobalt-precorrin-8 methylmutase
MVKAGLNHDIAFRLGCRIYCAAETSEGLAPTTGTRISKGMSSLARNMHGAIVAIGNAPSALLSLLRATKEGGPVPSLVIGMPVGFVQAVEAKELLASSGLPYITVAGSRGGSPVAVAAVNALLEFADERSAEKARDRY